MPLRLIDSDDPRHTLALHLIFYVVVNAVMLWGIGRDWLWVMAAWTVGLVVHVGVALRHHRSERARDEAQ